MSYHKSPAELPIKLTKVFKNFELEQKNSTSFPKLLENLELNFGLFMVSYHKNYRTFFLISRNFAIKF